MEKMTYKVTENNAGGITLYCVDANGNEFAHNGYEYHEGQLFQDLAAFLEDQDITGWEGNDLKDEEICRFARTKTETTEYGTHEILDDDIMYDKEGNLIPLSIEEYYDDDESSKLILWGDPDNMVIDRNRGRNFSGELKYLHLLFEAEDYCPKITIG